MKEASIKNIVNKLERNRGRGHPAVLFLGAGASVTSGIPTAEGIINHIMDSDKINRIKNINKLDYFEVMEGLDPGERFRILSHFINNSNVNKTHLIVALLVFLNYVDCIITTNFDPLIKNALTLFNIDAKEYDIPNNVNLSGQEIAHPSIIYLHGEYRSVWKLNTLRELQKNRGKTNIVISNVASHNSSWIVVGYSGKDFIFQQLCNIEVFNEGLYWIGYRQEQPQQQVIQELLSDETKNAYLVNGYTSDSFFLSLFNNLIDQKNEESIQPIGDRLNAVSLSMDYPDTSDLGVVDSIELTDECRKWTISKAKYLTSIGIEDKQRSVFQNTKNKLMALFTFKIETELQAHIRNKEYDLTLAKAKRYIKDYPEKPTGYYYKGAALGLKAEATDISTQKQATSLYEEMDKSFAKAKQIADAMSNPPSILDRIDPIKKSLWRSEHNLGVNFARPEDDLQNTVKNPLEFALGHLHNATIIQPDSAITWNALAQVNSLNENNKQAAKAQEKYLSLADSTTSRNYLVLAQYYNLSNQSERALSVLKKNYQRYPDSIKTVEMLADTYSKLGQSDKSINLVKELVQKNPSNGRYRMSLGTQIYQKEIKIQHKYDSNSDSLLTLQNKKRNASGDQADQIQDQMSQLQEQNANLKKQMDDLTQRALKQLHQAQNDGQNGANVYFTLGVIYQNKASVLFEQRNLTLDNDKANQLNKQARAQLKKARDNYNQAAQIDPNNKKYWRSLYQIYTALGNNQKAKKSKEKADIQ